MLLLALGETMPTIHHWRGWKFHFYSSDIVEQLRLGVVDTNAEAIRLYQKHGFEIYGTEIRALKSQCGYSNEVLMALRLKDD